MDKSSWSIIRWLPNEVLSEIVRLSGPRELAILLRVAKLFNEIGFPLLYRDVHLNISHGKSVSALSFRASIDQDPARARMIKSIRILALDLARCILLMKGCRNSNSDHFSVKAVNSILQDINTFTTVVPAILQLENVEVFRMTCEFHEAAFVELLEMASFPKMHTVTLAFRNLTVPPAISTFIDKHPTLRKVSLQCDTFSSNDAPPVFRHIELLEHISAPFDYFIAAVPNARNLTSASIDFSVYGIPEIERTFATLADSAARDSCKTLVCTTQASYNPLMDYISALLPKIENVTIRSGPLPRFASFDELSKLKHLKKFTHITTDKDDDVLRKAIDRINDKLFHGLSPTLSLLKLYGATWTRTNNGWVRAQS
ncbi:uncharacterized protein EV420DRAFT_1673185 [Desarmillaria tabescens]|uniref:F-box domain-containing protein n=1 Tax=Armillaria tabescens TaxID=1929756 RepID=A0AA39N6N5_ARMTA|nr:uncharacterized protein EV420DRAFT_1673185 [Desarmillaria tabescens]KAK0460141.1 hypothetical protein EV420DRAFT_1673185 [Desarmillaria tabescens]